MRLIGTWLSTIDRITARRRNIVILRAIWPFYQWKSPWITRNNLVRECIRTITGRDKPLLKISLSESSFCDTSSAILSQPTERETRLSCTPLFLDYRQQFTTRCKARFLENCNFINDMKFPMLRYRKLTADRQTIIHAPSFLHQRRRYRGHVSGIESPRFRSLWLAIESAHNRWHERVKEEEFLSGLRVAFSDCKHSRIKRTRVK